MPSSVGRLALRTFGALAILVVALGSAQAEKRAAPAPAPASDDAAVNLDQTVQALKDEVVQFNSDAAMADDEFLYPPHSRLTVYVSNTIQGFLLKDLTVSVDNGTPTTVTYDDYSARALLGKSPLQQVLRVNVPRGSHRLSAKFNGEIVDAKHPEDRKKPENQLSGTYEALFDKSVDAAAELELMIIRGSRKGGPTMQLKEWRAEE